MHYRSGSFSFTVRSAHELAAKGAGRVGVVVHVDVVGLGVLDDRERERAVDAGTSTGVRVQWHDDRAGCRRRADVDVRRGDGFHAADRDGPADLALAGIDRSVAVPTPSGSPWFGSPRALTS